MVSDKNSIEQHKRFLETARALGCDEEKGKFEAALGKIAAHKPLPKVGTLRKGADKPKHGRVSK